MEQYSICTLDLHPDWVVFQLEITNTFKRGHISRTLCNMWGHHRFIPFVCVFYAFEFPLFYSHRNHEGDVTIIPFAMGICQGALFALIHFRALCFIASHFPCCLFPSIANDTHIISLFSIVSFVYDVATLALGSQLR
jgi:hypothetical protein